MMMEVCSTDKAIRNTDEVAAAMNVIGSNKTTCDEVDSDSNYVRAISGANNSPVEWYE